MFDIAVYGGAFNPPHAGHARVLREAAQRARQVLVVPSFRHPDGKRMADYPLRVRWLQLMVESVQQTCATPMAVSCIEEQLASELPGPVYSYALLNHLAGALGIADKQLALVVGPDVQRQLPHFYRGPELLQRFAFIGIDEQMAVRSSLLRERLEKGQPLPDHWMAPGLDPLNYRHYAVAGN